jgi:predicted RNase H-like HicB family nuclease
MAVMHIPYTVEQGEDGAWSAHADFVTNQVRGGANGAGETEEEAIADLREALTALAEEYGPPRSAVMPMVLEVA